MRHGLLLFTALLALAAILAAPPPQIDAAAERIHLDVRMNGPQQAAERALTAAGFEIELSVPKLGRWQGWIAADRLDALRQLDGVIHAASPNYAAFSAGQAITEGDEALNASAARSRFDVDGDGVRIAVISDGIIGLREAQQDGEAPKLADARAFGAGDLNRGQEGTAMIEIVHDIAPGAAISFAAVATDLDHIAAVNYYAQRVDIIVDDVSYAFPADQSSDVSLNTTDALRHPSWPLRLYVTAAGNWAESHWAGDWQAGPDGSQLGLPGRGAVQQFDSAGRRGALFGAGNGFSVETDDRIRLTLFWDDPWQRSTNDYNLYLMTAAGEIAAASETTQGVGPRNHLPREDIDYQHEGAATRLFAVIQNRNNDAAPASFDLFAFQIGGRQLRFDQRTPAGSLLAQSDAEDALTVAAVNVGRNTVAPYSSRGPTLNGAAKPELSAVDRVTVSDKTKFAPRFSGSSAAAPHVAAVGALLLEVQPALLAADGGDPLLERRLIRSILIDTARDIPPDGPDLSSGAGLLDAVAALERAHSDIAVIDSSADSGPRTLRDALTSRASIILLQHSGANRTIILQSPLPTVSAGQIIDASGWTIDASAVDIGLTLADRAEVWGLAVSGAAEVGFLVAGDACVLERVRSTDNQVGIRIAGASAQLRSVSVSRSRRNGVEIIDGASASISASTIQSNHGSGVRIHPAAGDVSIAPPGQPPGPLSASSTTIPIHPFASLPAQARAGLSHVISGTVSIDGLPAPAGARLDLYLDRRLAASVLVDDAAGFRATAAGPGAELRFAVNGVPLQQRLAFRPGAQSSVSLRAVSPLRLIPAERADDLQSEANILSDNLVGVEIMRIDRARAGQRLVWGNRMSGNRFNILADRPQPTIEQVSWNAAGLTLIGTAPGEATVHLYAGPENDRRFIATAAVSSGRYSFRRLQIDESATEFSVIAHSAEHRASPESFIHLEPPPASINSITPAAGYIEGGETVQICGQRIATDAAAPSVWFGNRAARVIVWSDECITVTTPPAEAGPTDVALLLRGARPLIARDAFEYRSIRSVPLKQGWNFVTWAGADTRVTSAFASLAGAALRAYAWDAERQRWELFATALPPRLNTLRTIQHDQPLWIFLESPDTTWLQPAPD